MGFVNQFATGICLLYHLMQRQSLIDALSEIASERHFGS